MPSLPWSRVLHLLRNLVGSAQLDAEATVQHLSDGRTEEARLSSSEVAATTRLAGEVLRAIEHVSSDEPAAIDVGAFTWVLQCAIDGFRIEDVRACGRRPIAMRKAIDAGRKLLSGVIDGPGVVAFARGEDSVEFRSPGSPRDAELVSRAMHDLNEAGIPAACSSVSPCVVVIGQAARPAPAPRSTVTPIGGLGRKGSETDRPSVRRGSRRV